MLLFVFALLALPLCGQGEAPALRLDPQLRANSDIRTTSFDDDAEAQLVALINQARQENRLPPLAVDPRLTQAARKHTQRMLQHAALSHRFPDEPPLQDRVAAEGLRSDHAGENVAFDQTAASAHEELMDSPPHRRNILDPGYNAVGVGVIRQGENIWVTEDFARRLPEMSEPQAEAAVQTAIDAYERAQGFAAPARRLQPELRRMACDMALNDVVDGSPAARLPRVRTVFAWTAGDPAKLPKAIDRLLSSGLPAGYALEACVAPSVSHPGGVYWIVMVSY